MVAAAILAAHRHDTTVAATHPTPHDALNRHLTRTAEAQSRFRYGGEHAFGAACVNHHWQSSISGGEQPFKWRDNSPAFTRAAILSRQNQVDTH